MPVRTAAKNCDIFGSENQAFRPDEAKSWKRTKMNFIDISPCEEIRW
jgi:hypothetical protein